MTMWYPDTGATSHITVIPENIQHLRAFNGNNYIFTADGSPLLISQSGRSIFKSENRSFILKDLLLVPTVTRNLLSVNKFCIDNDVSLRFDSQKVQVRDRATDDLLIEGTVNDGSYELPMKADKIGTINPCTKLPHFR